jgi:hypothetical protein
MGKGFIRGGRGLGPFWDRVLKDYNVRANIGLSGETYRKFGTTFDNRIVVIDKTGPTVFPQAILDSEAGSIEEAMGLLEGIRNDRVHAGERYGKDSEKVAEEGGAAVGGPPGVDRTGATGVVGPREPGTARGVEERQGVAEERDSQGGQVATGATTGVPDRATGRGRVDAGPGRLEGESLEDASAKVLDVMHCQMQEARFS